MNTNNKNENVNTEKSTDQIDMQLQEINKTTKYTQKGTIVIIIELLIIIILLLPKNCNGVSINIGNKEATEELTITTAPEVTKQTTKEKSTKEQKETTTEVKETVNKAVDNEISIPVYPKEWNFNSEVDSVKLTNPANNKEYLVYEFSENDKILYTSKKIKAGEENAISAKLGPLFSKGRHEVIMTIYSYDKKGSKKSNDIKSKTTLIINVS